MQLWWRSNYGMKMQQSQPHGLHEPLAKNAILHCGSAPFFSHPCWKLDTLLWNQKMQSIIAICRVRTGHDWTSNPKPQETTLISDTPETPKLQTSKLQKHQISRYSRLLVALSRLSLWKFVSKDSNADSDFLHLNIGSNHTVHHSAWDLLFPQLKKVEVTSGTPWLIPERAPCPLHGKDLGAIGVVHDNCRCHRPVPGLQE